MYVRTYEGQRDIHAVLHARSNNAWYTYIDINLNQQWRRVKQRLDNIAIQLSQNRDANIIMFLSLVLLFGMILEELVKDMRMYVGRVCL